MSTFNIHAQVEQQQRIESDRIAVEREADRQNDLNSQGQYDGFIGEEPLLQLWHHDSYRQGWLSGVAERYDTRYKRLAEDLKVGSRANQGHLYTTAWQIKKIFNKPIETIGTDKDYKGWSIELNGLEIEIATFDWEDAESETKWTIYSIHPDALKFLAQKFGEDAVKDTIAIADRICTITGFWLRSD